MELRQANQEIRVMIAQEFCGYCSEYCGQDDVICGSALEHADSILALPKIAAGLKLLKEVNCLPQTKFSKLPILVRNIALEYQAAKVVVK